MSEYHAGVCNINQTERKKRLLMGIVSFVNALILITILFVFPSFTPLYAGIFVLNFAGFLGILQYRHHFCAGLGLKGKIHVDNSQEEVDDPEKVSKDRKKAYTIVAESLISSSLLIGFIYFLLSL